MVGWRSNKRVISLLGVWNEGMNSYILGYQNAEISRILKGISEKIVAESSLVIIPSP